MPVSSATNLAPCGQNARRHPIGGARTAGAAIDERVSTAAAPTADGAPGPAIPESGHADGLAVAAALTRE